MQGWTEWDQIRYKQFNWITFVLIEFEIERQLGDGVCIELGLFGFRLRIKTLWKPSELLEEMKKEAEEIKKGLDCKHTTVTAMSNNKEITCADCSKVVATA